MSGRVVVGFAPTPAGYEALRYAAGQAKQRGAPLIAVRAVHRDLDAMATEHWLETRVAVAAAVADGFRDALGCLPLGVDVRVVVEPGPVDRVLAAVVKQSDDLVVLGACSRRHWLSIRRHRTRTARCLRAAACPVVIVPVPEMARHGTLERLERDTVAEVERFLQDLRATESNGLTS